MRHISQTIDKKTSITTKKTRLVRNYDPLREIHQWNLVALVLLSELICVGFVSQPMYNSAFLLAGITGEIRPGTLVPFFLLLGTLPFFFTHISYRKEEQTRARRRHEALMLHDAGQTESQTQPSSLSQEFSLPMQIENRRRKSFTLRLVFEIVLLVASLIANYIYFLADPSQPVIYAITPSLLFMMIMGLSLAIFFEIYLYIPKYYMLPSLIINDESITARYGRNTVVIAWRDIRYFALVDSATWRQLPTSDKHSPTLRQILKSGMTWSSTPVSQPEVFEISDGNNAICWLKMVRIRHHCLLYSGEAALSSQDYATFSQQLATLIVERTGLPLYDLRLLPSPSS